MYNIKHIFFLYSKSAIKTLIDKEDIYLRLAIQIPERIQLTLFLRFYL